jgi:DNA invertase Pin-like site-specific DNA recombinase
MVKEFIAPAQSASRGIYPALRDALRYIEQQGDIDLFIVYRLDRFARDELTQFTALAELRRLGVKLVSVTEQIDESPQGMLTMSLLGAVNAYRSRDDGRKIKEGLVKKAELGGTPTRAKLGYLNHRHWDGANDIRTVALDPQRAPHLLWGFQTYATGDISLSELADLLYDRGLRNRSNRKNQKSYKVKVPTLHKILRDPYYIGVVQFGGVRYDGSHPKLVPVEVFDRVQQVLTSRRLAGDRSHKHSHYLRGVVHCSLCRRAMMFTRCKAKGGYYEYFVCIGRHREKNCQMPYLSVEHVERSVTRYYEREIKLSAGRVAQLKPKLLSRWEYLTVHRLEEADRCEREVADLREQRQRLVDGHIANPRAVPLDVLEVKQAELEEKIRLAESKLERARADIEQSKVGLDLAHAALRDAPALYRAADPVERRSLNQVFFTRLLVGPEGIEGADLTDEFAAILGDELVAEISEAEKMGRWAARVQAKAEPPFGGVSTFDRIVEAPRFELGSADAVRGCLQV